MLCPYGIYKNMSVIFSPITLEVDTALWGSFWQGDVISAGYTLPALELAFLRENRLARTTDAATPDEYFAQLQNSLALKPIGEWKTSLARHAVRCIAVPESSQWRIIWRDDDTIFANYGSPPITTPGYHLQSVQSPIIGKPTPPPEHLQSFAQQIYETFPQWADDWQSFPLAARIDRLIQAHRAYSLLPTMQNDIATWLNAFWR